MARRIHVPHLRVGVLPLDQVQAHHARTVLRLTVGTEVDLFDDAGATARGTLSYDDDANVSVCVDRVVASSNSGKVQWTVAAAVPKGDRADWMVEKLSELGASAFIPLAASRSVVLPGGTSKRDRWVRISTESAKQCRRAGVMRIEPLTTLNAVVERVVVSQRIPSGSSVDSAQSKRTSIGWFLATEVLGLSIRDAIETFDGNGVDLTVLIGPEGGWTNDEIAMMESSGLFAIRLGSTILRVETAAIAAGAVLSTLR